MSEVLKRVMLCIVIVCFTMHLSVVVAQDLNTKASCRNFSEEWTTSLEDDLKILSVNQLDIRVLKLMMCKSKYDSLVFNHKMSTVDIAKENLVQLKYSNLQYWYRNEQYARAEEFIRSRGSLIDFMFDR